MMQQHSNATRLFQRCIHGWLFLYLATALPAYVELWSSPLSPVLAGPPGIFRAFTHAFDVWLPGALALPVVLIILAIALWGIVDRIPWWASMIAWLLFTSLMNRAWLSASGGEQLMANVLFWSIFLSVPERLGSPIDHLASARNIVHAATFWIIRLQLVVAYAVTAIHKLVGHDWIHGYSVGIVASDPDYGPAFLMGHEELNMLLTYGILAFQISFPIAIWFNGVRRPWMWLGVAFHLSTAVCFGIPDMAFAFLAVYPIWFQEGIAEQGNARWNSMLRLPLKWSGLSKKGSTRTVTS